jgi:hypothetical protein
VVRRLARLVKKATVESRQTERAVDLDVKVSVEPDGEAKIVAVETSPRPESDERLDRAIDAARARGEARVAEILNRPEMLSADAFGELLGTSRMTVHEWRQSRRVLGLEGAKRGFRFPDWQVGQDGKPFGALPALFERLGDEWAVYRFLVQHHPELDGLTGKEALQRGQSDKVIETAETISQTAFA